MAIGLPSLLITVRSSPFKQELDWIAFIIHIGRVSVAWCFLLTHCAILHLWKHPGDGLRLDLLVEQAGVPDETCSVAGPGQDIFLSFFTTGRQFEASACGRQEVQSNSIKVWKYHA